MTNINKLYNYISIHINKYIYIYIIYVLVTPSDVYT